LAKVRGTIRKKKIKKRVSSAVAKIKATFNNTIITIIDDNGEVLTWASGGTVGYSGSKKSTPFASQMAAENCVKVLADMGVKSMEINYAGPGPGREPAIKVFQNSDIRVTGIKDETPTPYNGCKLKKRKRA
jgi:small subunit ribosomal protein S11